MELAPDVFQCLKRFIISKSGNCIPDDKAYVIKQRLEPIALELGCNSFAEFYFQIRKDSDKALTERIVNAVTTNETSFFRDIHPFETFREHILPKVCNNFMEHRADKKKRDGDKIRIWCSASSTGQEPYSLAFMIFDFLESNEVPGIRESDFYFFSTDISTEALDKAKKGFYKGIDIERGLDDGTRERYFRVVDNGYQVIDEVREFVHFDKFNLISDFDFEPLDIIFCRNVLYYFDEGFQKDIYHKIHDVLRPEGILFIGTAENIPSDEELFQVRSHKESYYFEKI